MKPIVHCRSAQTKQELDDAARVRWAVFGREKGYLTEEAPRVSRDLDRLDTLESTVHILAYVEKEPAGTARLLVANSSVAEENGLRFGIGLELKINLGAFETPGVVVAE